MTVSLFDSVMQDREIERPLSGTINPKSGRVSYYAVTYISDSVYKLVGHPALLLPASCGALFEPLEPSDAVVLLIKQFDDFAFVILDKRDLHLDFWQDEPGFRNREHLALRTACPLAEIAVALSGHDKRAVITDVVFADIGVEDLWIDPGQLFRFFGDVFHKAHHHLVVCRFAIAHCLGRIGI